MSDDGREQAGVWERPRVTWQLNPVTLAHSAADLGDGGCFAGPRTRGKEERTLLTA